jgi:(p)ppGpp synthase/HD superfamily hydrolase
MDTELVLKKVRQFAADAHTGQKRKYTPDDYIVHPERVMAICGNFSPDAAVLSAALLHDVLEDTDIKPPAMLAFLRDVMEPEKAKRTMELVIELTDTYTRQAFPQWNRKKRKQMERERLSAVSHDAQTIKYADVLDNSNEIVQHDPFFAGVFLGECRLLLTCMTGGNQKLRDMAIRMVEKNLQILDELQAGEPSP